MKKFFAVIFCAIIVSSFSACGCNFTISQATPETTQAATAAPTTSNAQTATKSSILHFENIDEYLAHPSVKAVLDNAKEQYKSLYDINVYADGDNVLVYEYKLLDQVPNDSFKALESSLEKQMESQAALIKPLMRELNAYVDIDDPKVTLRFLNKDGSKIFEYTFDSSILNEEETTKAE